jgi:anti-anti-sigma factor
VGLKIQMSRIEPDFVVVHLSGSLTLGNTEHLDSVIGRLLRQGDKKFVFEVSRIHQIDGSGATSIVCCFFAAGEAGGGLRIGGASRKVALLFETTRLDSVVPFYPTVAAAYEHFTGSSSKTSG